MSEQHARITDEMIERMRSTIGQKKGGVHNAWNNEASYDSIRQYAWGIGDPNPLWLDREYANSSVHGTVIAPPSWLYSCKTGPLGPFSRPSQKTGMPGIHGLYVGDSWEFHDHVRLGDRILSERYLDSVEEMSSHYAGRMVRTLEATRFFRPDGETIAIARSEIRKHERGTPKKDGVDDKAKADDQSGAKKRGNAKYADIEPWLWSDDDLERIALHYASEKPRGTDPLDWKTIVVGEEIPRRLKGPLTSTSIITYLMGWGSPFCMTDRIAHEYIRLHPKANVPDVKTRSPDFPERAHWDELLYREIGFPLGYDIGPCRISWFSHLLTDWIGDAGRILSYKVDLREPNWIGDITWLRGRILEKSLVAGEPRVKLELWGESQRGRIHARGEAWVVVGDINNVGSADLAEQQGF